MQILLKDIIRGIDIVDVKRGAQLRSRLRGSHGTLTATACFYVNNIQTIRQYYKFIVLLASYTCLLI